MSVESSHVPVPYSCCITCICIPSLMVSGSVYHLSGHQDLGITIWSALLGKNRYCQTPVQSDSTVLVSQTVDFVLVSHPPFQGWSPSIPRMVNQYPHDGHTPSPGWSPTNSRMVTRSTKVEFDFSAAQLILVKNTLVVIFLGINLQAPFSSLEEAFKYYVSIISKKDYPLPFVIVVIKD